MFLHSAYFKITEYHQVTHIP